MADMNYEPIKSSDKDKKDKSSLKDTGDGYNKTQNDDRFFKASFPTRNKKIMGEDNLDIQIFKDRSYLPQDVNRCVRALLNDFEKSKLPQDIMNKVIDCFDLEKLSIFPENFKHFEKYSNISQDEVIKENTISLLLNIVTNYNYFLNKKTITQINSIIDKYIKLPTFSQHDQNFDIREENNNIYVYKPFLPKDVNEGIKMLIQELQDDSTVSYFYQKINMAMFDYNYLSTSNYDNEKPSNENLSRRDIEINIKHNVIKELTITLLLDVHRLSKETVCKINTIIKKYSPLLYFPLEEKKLSQKELDNYVFEDQTFLPKDVNECIRSILKDYNKDIDVSPMDKKRVTEFFNYDDLSAPIYRYEDEYSFDDYGLSDYDRAVNIKEKLIAIFRESCNQPFISKKTKKQIKNVIKKYKKDTYFQMDEEE